MLMLTQAVVIHNCSCTKLKQDTQTPNNQKKKPNNSQSGLTAFTAVLKVFLERTSSTKPNRGYNEK